MLRDMIKKNNANARREPLWHRALAMFLAIQMACPPVMARGPGRAGVDALMEEPDQLAPARANLPEIGRAHV